MGKFGHVLDVQEQAVARWRKVGRLIHLLVCAGVQTSPPEGRSEHATGGVAGRQANEMTANFLVTSVYEWGGEEYLHFT